MNILYICHRLPYPPNKGCKIRAFRTIEHLARHHDVSCACFVDDPADMQYVPALREFCREVIAIPLNRKRALVRGMMDLAIDETMTGGFYRSNAMADALRNISTRIEFDALVVFSSGMGQYAECVEAPTRIIDLCDLDSAKWASMAQQSLPPRSWLFEAEAHRLAQTERDLYEQFDATILISAQEANDWTGDRAKLHIMGNGVRCPHKTDDRPSDSKIIGFVGDMRYMPNVDAVCWFATEIFPLIREHDPDAKFHIIGRSPTRRVRQLARQAAIHVTGEVDDVWTHLRRCQIAVAPLRIARGVQNKVLESMAAGVPVVATSPVAAALQATSGEHLLVADDVAGFVARVVELLRDPSRCTALGSQARRWVASAYRWPTQLSILDDLLVATPARVVTRLTTAGFSR
ncbi:MAG: TIGR03087 family PEP-CTERM/XrtA system glycosyltransferase [Planctomycetes bacterium]|nr:TIGR03087 family PEP-CTERM/XrtA system glycosyltransferase [Planctomycetota bacterium]